jgi:hypothetical protein
MFTRRFHALQKMKAICKPVISHNDEARLEVSLLTGTWANSLWIVFSGSAGSSAIF